MGKLEHSTGAFVSAGRRGLSADTQAEETLGEDKEGGRSSFESNGGTEVVGHGGSPGQGCRAPAKGSAEAKGAGGVGTQKHVAPRAVRRDKVQESQEPARSVGREKKEEMKASRGGSCLSA